MTMEMPSWYPYLVFDVDEDDEPVLIGFRKDTPKEEIKKYKAYLKQQEEEQKEREHIKEKYGVDLPYTDL